MWNDTLHGIAKAMPPFNEYLLRQFRSEKISQMVEYLDEHFRNTVVLFRGQLEYIGYEVLSPVEAVKHQLASATKRTVKVNRNSVRTVRFEFRMGIESFYLHVLLPYMVDGCVYIDDTRNYPVFTIIERLVHKAEDFVTINPGIVRLLFYRQKQYTIRTTTGVRYREYSIGTKIHHAKVAKSAEKPPLIAYHLIEHGFVGALALHEMTEDDIRIVEKEEPAEGYIFFELPNGLFIRVREAILVNKRNLRFVIGLTRIFRVWKHFTLNDVYASTDLFKVALGKFVHPSKTDPARLAKYIDDHMVSCRGYLDPTTQRLAAKAGYPSADISELLLHVWNNIDAWLLMDGDSYNLYQKKLGSLSSAIAPLIVQLMRAQFSMFRNNPRRTLAAEDVRRFVNKASSRSAFWFEGLCRSNPAIVNGNWLFSIGLKMRKDPMLAETNPGGQQCTRATSTMMITHPSWLVVESIVTLPSGNPLAAGTINPFLAIDSDGNIIEPEWSDDIKDICN